MTGLLAFNSNTRSDRQAEISGELGVADLDRTSNTGMGLPKTYTRKRSLNAKYDRLLGNTQSMRTGRGSTQTLAEVGSQFRMREEEEKEKVKKDNMEIYRKLGIKMPASRGRDLNGGVGVMANLDRYRLGSIPPPRGLDEKLRSILYPPPPPPTPPAPTPSPIQLISEQYYPAGARIAKAPQPSSKTHHLRQARDYQQPAHYPPQQTPLRQVHYPPPPFPPTAGPPSVQGWIYTPQNGWIYIPPPQPYFAHGGYPGIPPPPPFSQEATCQAYPSPYSDTPTSHDQENIPSSSYYNTSSPNYNLGQDQEQIRPFPKSILRDTSSSETSGHGRSVKFRDTPEYNSPELYQGEVEEYETPVLDPEPEADVYSPPKWTLHKAPSAHQQSRRPNDEENGQHSRGPIEQDQGRGAEAHAHPQQPSYYHDRGMQQNVPIPALLATAHQQLLSGHGLTTAQVASGKRSGRDLIRSLESMAEVQDRTTRDDETAHSTRNGDVQMDDDYEHQERTSGHHRSVTPRRQVFENGQSNYHQTDIRQSQQDPHRDSTDRDQTYHLEQYGHDRTKESPMYEPRPQTTPIHGNARTPGRQSTTNDPMDLSSRHVPRRREEHRTPESASQDSSSRYGPRAPHDQPRYQPQSRHAPREEEEPRPDDVASREQSPPKQPETPHRQRATKSRLPPPSQNWRESQRPQMAFSQTESLGSQVPVSQTSYRGSQDHPGSSGKKRSRLELEEDDEVVTENEEADENAGGPEHGAQTFDRYSPNQLSQDTTSNPHSQDRSSRNRPPSQGRQNPQTQPKPNSRSSQQQASPPIPTSTSKRHRLTDLDLPIDIDDPSDTSYRPPNSYPGDQDQDEDEEYEDQPESDSPEPEPEGKRIKLTEGAWMKYDIPQDKLPIPRHPIQAKKTRPVTTRLIKPIKNESQSQSQSQSQISQIEQSDDEEDTSVSWLGEDIDESLSQNYSDISAKGNKNGRLSTIAEEEDEEDEEDEGMEQVHNGGGSGQKGWVEDGFFGDGGGTGFTVWRDRY